MIFSAMGVAGGGGTECGGTAVEMDMKGRGDGDLIPWSFAGTEEALSPRNRCLIEVARLGGIECDESPFAGGNMGVGGKGPTGGGNGFITLDGGIGDPGMVSSLVECVFILVMLLPLKERR